MFTLHEIDPEIFSDEDVPINLEILYKNHYRNSHLSALEEVFKAGAIYALAHVTTADVVDYDAETKNELDRLRGQFAELQNKYESLLAKVAATPPNSMYVYPRENEMPVALDQVMGMGKVFKS